MLILIILAIVLFFVIIILLTIIPIINNIRSAYYEAKDIKDYVKSGELKDDINETKEAGKKFVTRLKNGNLKEDEEEYYSE